MAIGIIFVVVLVLCIAKPKYGIFGIFLFAIVLSNALQQGFVQTNRVFSAPLSLVPLSGIDLIDRQGTRLLTLVLFVSTLTRGFFRKQVLKEKWLVMAIASITFLSTLSMVVNDISFKNGLSSISLFAISLLFLFSVLNVKFEHREITMFLRALLLFVSLNAVVQIYQFFTFADGDIDMTPGLLMSTTPTSTIAFVTILFFVGKSTIGKIDKTVWVSVAVAIAQLGSSYLKGIVAFAMVIVIGFRKVFSQGGRALVASLIVLTVLFGISSFLFTDAVKDYGVFRAIPDIESVVKLGPIRVWTQFFELLQNPTNLVLGYGPSSYGSLNTTDEMGTRTSRLAQLISIAGVGEFEGRDLFVTALSSAGNILWENGMFVFLLFFGVHFKVFRDAAKIHAYPRSDWLKVYSFGVKYGLVFVLLLYFTAFGVTTEEVLLWGPIFVVYSFVKSEYHLRLVKDS